MSNKEKGPYCDCNHQFYDHAGAVVTNAGGIAGLCKKHCGCEQFILVSFLR